MKSVLVTGGNRTGTSWVGEMLCLADELFYVWEPFNCMFPVPFCKHPLSRHYRMLLPQESRAMKRHVRKKTFFDMVNATKGGKGISSKFRKVFLSADKAFGYLTGRKAPLFKDPTALMSARWFENQFSSRVVLVVRHPGAYVNSIKRLDWPMCVEEFANQSWLMDTLPDYLQKEIHHRISQRSRPGGYVLEDAAICWKVFYQVVHQYNKANASWLLVKHENLSLDYIAGFKELYRELDLTWNTEVEEKIEFFCSPKNKVVQGNVYHQFKQDSASLTRLWKSKLSYTERKIIRDITEPVAGYFYDSASWE